MSRNKEWYGILSDAAQQRGIKLPFDDPDLLDDQTAVRLGEWVDQNLRNVEPLTKEELTLWQAICRKKGQSSEDVDDAATSVPLNEGLLREAIDDIKASTQTTHNRIHTLEHQRKIKTDLDNGFAGVSGYGTSFNALLQRRQQAEKQQIFFLNNEAELEIQEKIRTAQENIEKCIKTVSSRVQEKLRVDDRTLNSLESLVSQINSDGPSRPSKTQRLLNTLQNAIVLSLKTRLDHIYLREINTRVAGGEASESSEELTQTRNDLQSLYAEIEDVASMLVDNMYGSKMKILEDELAFLVNEDTAHNASRVIDQLKMLTESTDQLAAHYRLLQAHQSVYTTINELQLQVRGPDLLEMTINDRSRVLNQTALLRHLNTEAEEDTAASEIVERLHKQSENLLRNSQGATKRTVSDANRSITENSRLLQNLLPPTNSYLKEVTQKSSELDKQIALVSSRFETASHTTDTDIFTRMKFVNDSSRQT